MERQFFISFLILSVVCFFNCAAHKRYGDIYPADRHIGRIYDRPRTYDAGPVHQPYLQYGVVHPDSGKIFPPQPDLPITKIRPALHHEKKKLILRDQLEDRYPKLDIEDLVQYVKERLHYHDRDGLRTKIESYLHSKQTRGWSNSAEDVKSLLAELINLLKDKKIAKSNKIREVTIRSVKLNKYLDANRPTSVYIQKALLSYNNRVSYFLEGDDHFGKRVKIAKDDNTCLSSLTDRKKYFASSQPCSLYEDPIFRWKLIPCNDYFLIEQANTGYCLQPDDDISYPTLVRLRPCSRSSAIQLWALEDARKLTYY